LTQLFLTNAGDPWGSWGLWEAKDRPPGTGVFIALSDRFLGDVKSLSDLETDVAAKLLELTAPMDLKKKPRFIGGDDPAVVTLSVLAHELGHILLAVTNADGVNRHHPRRRVLGPPVSACFDHAFIARSWNKQGFQHSMRRWAPFAEQLENRQKHISFNLSSLKGKIDAADEAISQVYSSGEFVSAFAAAAPEDDISETFRYKVLADVEQPVAIRIFGKDRDISLREFLAGRYIKKKVDCLRELKFFSQR
jgi:hypothetical protein